MNKNDQQFMAQKIRTQYMEKEASELDALRQLDKKVKRPVNIFSYVFGSLSAIIMGTGMSLVMTELPAMLGLGDMMIPGIIIGVVGMLLVITNYPIHKSMMNHRKRKYADEILKLSERIINKK